MSDTPNNPNAPVVDEKPFKIRILWGQSHEPDDEPTQYEFATEAEFDAFMHGVDEANGWLNYEVFNQNADSTWPEPEREEEEEGDEE
jgi:hypothetical protein